MENLQKYKLGFMSDNPCTNTGFSTVSKDLINRLSKKEHYDCKMMGHNYIGQPLQKGTKFIDGTPLNFELHPGGKQPFAQDVLSYWIKQNKFDMFWVLLDTFMVYPWFKTLDTSPAKTVFYFPSDGEARLPIGCEEILKRVDMPVAMSKFAQRQAWKVHGVKTEYIPHAVDRTLFYKLEEEDRKKAKANWGLKDKFVIGTVARNQSRKMMDRTIKAFALFAKGKDDVILLAHTDPDDNAAVFNIKELIQRYKLHNKILFTGTRYYKGFTYEQMREVYNIMDVFFLSTSGEGFGIPTIEAAACGVPSVVTDFTTTQELLMDNGQCGLPVKCLGSKDDTLTGSWNVERGVMDIVDGAEQLTKLYEDRELGKKLGEVGIEKVKKFYDWENIADEWDRLIRKLLEA